MLLTAPRRRSAPRRRPASCPSGWRVLGADVILDTLARLDALTPQPQRHEAATLAPRLKKTDGVLDWRRPARDLVESRARAATRGPAPRPRVAGGALTLWRARAVAGRRQPGTLVRARAHVWPWPPARARCCRSRSSRRAGARRRWDEFLRGARLDRRSAARAREPAAGDRPPRREPVARRASPARAVARGCSSASRPTARSPTSRSTPSCDGARCPCATSRWPPS